MYLAVAVHVIKTTQMSYAATGCIELVLIPSLSVAFLQRAAQRHIA